MEVEYTHIVEDYFGKFKAAVIGYSLYYMYENTFLGGGIIKSSVSLLRRHPDGGGEWTVEKCYKEKDGYKVTKIEPEFEGNV